MLVLNALVTFALMVITCPTLVKKKKISVIPAHVISDVKICLNACAIEQFHLIILITFVLEKFKLMITEKALKTDADHCDSYMLADYLYLKRKGPVQRLCAKRPPSLHLIISQLLPQGKLKQTQEQTYTTDICFKMLVNK